MTLVFKKPFLRLQKIKKNCYDDDKKIKKIKKGITEHRTYANPPPKAPTQKPNGGGYA